MGQRGRPPKPLALRELEGRPAKEAAFEIEYRGLFGTSGVTARLGKVILDFSRFAYRVNTPALKLFDALMAGSSAVELQPFIAQLASSERLALLCLVCLMVDDMGTNCAERAATLKQVLANNCEYFTGSVACHESCKGKVPFELSPDIR
jgi:hypothetical protein